MNNRVILVIVILFLPVTFVCSQNKVVEETTIISGQDTPFVRKVKDVTHFDVSNQRPIFKVVTDSIIGSTTNTNCYYSDKMVSNLPSYYLLPFFLILCY